MGGVGVLRCSLTNTGRRGARRRSPVLFGSRSPACTSPTPQLIIPACTEISVHISLPSRDSSLPPNPCFILSVLTSLSLPPPGDSALHYFPTEKASTQSTPLYKPPYLTARPTAQCSASPPFFSPPPPSILPPRPLCQTLATYIARPSGQQSGVPRISPRSSPQKKEKKNTPPASLSFP